MKSLQGQLLLASGRLADPNFARTVILVVQHDENGALGLVLNRPLKATVADVSADALSLHVSIDAPLYHGGPCEGPMMVLHTRSAAGETKVLPEIFLTTDRVQIESLLLSDHATMKFFVGYAGWSAEQLEGELEFGSWLPVTASREDVFTDHGGPSHWERLMQKLTLGKWIDPARIPNDPSVN